MSIKTISLSLVYANGSAVTDYSNLQFAFFATPLPVNFGAPEVTGNGVNITGGLFEITLHTALNVGDTGFLILTNTNGSSAQSPSAIVFAGPVLINNGDRMTTLARNAYSFASVAEFNTFGGAVVYGEGPLWISKKLYWSNGSAIQAVSNSDGNTNAFNFTIGADHSAKSAWGVDGGTNDSGNLTATGNGYMQFLLDQGVIPYLAVCTSTYEVHTPGGSTAMTWDNLRALQSRGVEILSHSHQHIQQWDSTNTGIRIKYNGAGATATVAITSATITLVSATGGAENAVLTRSSYTSIIDVINAINAVTNWIAFIEDGSSVIATDAQTLLLAISGNRDVKSTANNSNGQRFACGCGLKIYQGNAGGNARTYRTLNVGIGTGAAGYLEIHIDGVRYYQVQLSTLNFAALATAMNAALNSYGVYVAICDNGWGSLGGSTVNYMQGDEQAQALVTLSPANQAYEVTPVNLALHPAVISAGLSQWHIRDRQFQKSFDLLTAQGIDVKGFAEPGNYFYGFHKQGHTQFNEYRGTTLTTLNQQPVCIPTYLAKNGIARSYCSPLFGFTTPGHMMALAQAMADSPGLSACFLWHGLDNTGGNGGYEIDSHPSADQTMLNAQAFFSALNPLKTAEKIKYTKFSEKSQGKQKKPINFLFNPRFRTRGSVIPAGKSNELAEVPGWVISCSNAVGASIQPNGDTITCTSLTNAATFTIYQSVQLEPGKRYEYGFVIDSSNVTAGNGAKCSIRAEGGFWDNARQAFNQGLNAGLNNSASNNYSTTLSIAAGAVVERFFPSLPSTSKLGARIVSRANGPYVITAGSNDQLKLMINGITSAVNLTLTAGSRSAKQVADEINAWISTDANLSGYPEFIGIAKAMRLDAGSAVLVLDGGSIIDNLQIFGSSVTATAMSALFGGNGSSRYFSYSVPNIVPDASLYPVQFAIQIDITGSMTIRAPWVKILEI